MDLSSLFESFCIVVARQLGQKRKRRTAQLRRRLGAQHLEARMMLTGDPLTDYNDSVQQAEAQYATAQASADGVWLGTETAAENTFSSAAAADDATFQTTAAAADNALNISAATADDVADTATAAADEEANAETEAASNTEQQDVASEQQVEDTADTNAEAALTAATNSADTAYSDTVASDASAYDVTAAAQQATHDTAVAANDAAFNAEVTADDANYSNTEAALLTAEGNADASAAATRDLAIGSNGAVYDPSAATGSVSFQAAWSSASDTFNSQMASYTATQVTSDAQADTDFNSVESAGSNLLGTADANAQQAYDSAVQNATNQESSSEAAAANTLAGAITSDLTAFNTANQGASNQYATDMQTATTTLETEEQSADDAYNTSAAGPQTTYNSWLQTRTTQYNNDKQSRLDQLSQDLLSAETNYNNTMAPAIAMNAASVQADTDDYNTAVTGYSLTQGNLDAVSEASYLSAMQGADQTLQSAEDAYSETLAQIIYNSTQPGGAYDQAAADAAQATLNTAQHAYASFQVQQEATLAGEFGQHAIAFENSEEGAYVTEQNAIAADDATLTLADADASKTLADAQADENMGYQADIAVLTATYDNDVAAKNADLTKQLTAFEQTREDAYLQDIDEYQHAQWAAWDTETKADADAAVIEAEGDALAQQTEEHDIAEDQRVEENSVSAAGETLVDAEAAANTTYASEVVAAEAARAATKAADALAILNEEAGALAQWVTAVSDAEASAISDAANGDPTVTTVANAWANYYIAEANDFVQFMSANTAAALQNLNAGMAAWESDMASDAAADESLDDGLAADQVTENDQDASAAVLLTSQLASAAVTAVDQEATARGQDMKSQTDTLSQYAGKIVDSGLHLGVSYAAAGLTWVQAVVSAGLTDMIARDNAGAANVGAIAHDMDTYEHAVDQATKSEITTMTPAAQTEISQVANAHNVYGNAMAAQSKLDEDALMAALVNYVANQPDGAFGGVAPGSGDSPSDLFSLGINDDVGPPARLKDRVVSGCTYCHAQNNWGLPGLLNDSFHVPFIDQQGHIAAQYAEVWQNEKVFAHNALTVTTATLTFIGAWSLASAWLGSIAVGGAGGSFAFPVTSYTFTATGLLAASQTTIVVGVQPIATGIAAIAFLGDSIFMMANAPPPGGGGTESGVEQLQQKLEQIQEQRAALEEKIESIERSRAVQRQNGGIGEGYDTSGSESELMQLIRDEANLISRINRLGG